MNKKVKVIYVVGSGRSGSTVLDLVLGNCKGVHGVGELVNLFTFGWNNNEYCSCGSRGRECSFWIDVLRVWADNSDCSIDEYINLQGTFESNVVNLLGLQRRIESNADEFSRYLKATTALYEAISKVSGCGTVVDSSKLPARGLALSYLDSVDLRFLHLIRDGRGVAWSLNKSYKKDEEAGIQSDIQKKPYWRTALFWLLMNFQALYVCRKSKKPYCRLKYEEFMASPRRVFDDLSETLSVDTSSLIEKLELGNTFSNGHSIAGNRLRMDKSIKLKFDIEWKNNISFIDNMTFRLIAGIGLIVFGYSI